MPESDLRNLWKLHLVDHQLLEIRQRAAALDPGKKLLTQIAALNTQLEAKSAQQRQLMGEQTDLELQQKSIDDKLKRIDKDLYGGKVVNPREVEALQKEIKALKDRRGDLDIKILELWDLTPPASREVQTLEAEVSVKKKELEQFQKKVLIAKGQLEKDFKELSAKRPLLAKEVPPAILSRYDAIRQKHDGTGMAGISKKGTCEACGTNLPTKTIESAKEQRLVTCEACHRILYYTEGLI